MKKCNTIITVLFILESLVSVNASTIGRGKAYNPPGFMYDQSTIISDLSHVDIKPLSEVINGTSSAFPIYISEINSGLIYYTDNKNSNNVLISRDFFFSKFDSTTSTWSKPINLLKDYSLFREINKNMNFVEIFVTIDNDIYSVDLKKSEFSPQKLNINTKYIETSPSLSPDGNTLYFISNRPGGFGGKDIWASERLSNGNWSAPVNLGNKVNSSEDEESPFMMSDGATLYFSSMGHKSYGGYDIFTSTQNDDGLWSAPENLGTPVNSTSDDYCFITDSLGINAYYSSDKMQKGNQNIYSVIFHLAQ
jgi:hypothetical protein